MRAKALGLLLLAFGCGEAAKPAHPSTTGGQGTTGGSPAAAGVNGSSSGNGGSGVVGGNLSSGGSAGTSGSGGSSNPIGVVLGDTPAEACIAYGWAVCSRREACRVGSPGVANCTSLTLSCPDLSFSPGATRTVAVLKECAATYATLACDQVRTDKLPSCVTPGTRMRGEECAFASQCNSLSCSLVNNPGLCGSCGVRAAKGESCAQADVECEFGTECNPNTGLCDSPLIVDSLPGLNQACVPSTSCKPGYYCKGDGAGGGLCAAQPNANESCADAPCASGNYCSPDSVCKPYPLPGQPCGVDKSGSLTCDGRGFCDAAPGSTSGTCKAAPKVGEPCIPNPLNPDNGYCVTAGLHCDNTATPWVCKGPGKAGEICFSPNDCFGLSSCDCDDPQAPDCAVRHCTELRVANQPCTAPNTRCHPAFECVAGVCQPLTLRGDFTAACGP
jgi:hypothetical protein